MSATMSTPITDATVRRWRDWLLNNIRYKRDAFNTGWYYVGDDWPKLDEWIEVVW